MLRKEGIRKLGISDHVHHLYYKFNTALRPDVYKTLDEIEFEDINNDQLSEVAVFPLFHSDQYMTVLCCLIAHNLKHRGIGSVFLFDNNSFEACKGNPELPDHRDNCISCIKRTRELAKLTNVPIQLVDTSDYIEPSQGVKNDLTDFVESSVINQLKIATIDESDRKHQKLLERYYKTAYKTWEWLKSLDNEYGFDYLISSGSPYVPRGVGILYAKKNNISMTAFGDPNKGINNRSLRFGRMDGPLSQYISDVAWRKIKKSGLNKHEDNKIKEYMDSRMNSNKYTKKSQGNINISQKLSLKEGQTYSMFTHLPWDAAVVGASSVFDNQYEWIVRTIESFKNKRADCNLIVKTHPAEKILGTNESTLDVINRRLSNIPDNITILEPDTEINPYDLVRASDVVLVYNSTVGMESVYLDTPVVVSSSAHYANKGFTYDAASRSHYQKLLNKTELYIDENKKELAKIYMYNYFIERPIFIDLFCPSETGGYEISRFNSYDQLSKGGNKTINDIGKAIELGTSLFYTNSHTVI